MFRSTIKPVGPVIVVLSSLVVVVASTAVLRSADIALVERVRESGSAGVKSALTSGADPNTTDATGATPLMHAAAVGSVDTMRLLLAGGADINAAANDGTTALMWATADAEKVRVLLDAGARIDARATDGTTALVAAAQRGAADVVRLLLARHANPTASDAGGTQLLQAAFSTTSGEVRAILARAGVQPTHIGQVAPALLRIDYIDHDVISRALALHLDPNTQLPLASVKMPLLGYTSMLLGPETVQLLLDAGADPNAVSSRGVTALMMAAASARPDPALVRLLLARGARLDARDDMGRTALDWALLQGETDVARQLRAAGAASSSLPSTATSVVAGAPRPMKAAVEKGLSTLSTIGPAFYNKTGCVSCHNQSLPAMARQLAASRGVISERAVASHADTATLEMFGRRRNAAFIGACGGSGYIPTVTYGLVAMADNRTPANSVTDAAAVCLASRQSADGSWKVNDIRPPLSGSPLVFTALAVRGLDAYAPAALRPDYEARIGRARAFLLYAEPNDSQEEVFKLLGLIWARASGRDVAAQASRVAALQGADGGWAQTPLMASDAYATGQALYALRLAGTAVSTARYQAGMNYLLRTQGEDGSWFVQSRGVPFQPYAEYGFAHGRHQFISAAATSWALMALAPAI